MVADSGVNPQLFLSPQGRLLIVDFPVGRVTAMERHITGQQQDVRLLFAHFSRQPFAHARIGVGRVAGFGKPHIPINDDAQRPSRRQIRNRKRRATIRWILRKALLCRGEYADNCKKNTKPTDHYRPPPTKWTISRRSPSARPALVHSVRGTILPLCSMATRSPLRSSSAIKSWRLAPGASCGNSRDWPLRTKCIEAEYHRPFLTGCWPRATRKTIAANDARPVEPRHLNNR